MRVLKRKQLMLDQRKIDFARRYFGVRSDAEAIDRALSLLMEDDQIAGRMQPLARVLRGDVREWPYG